MDPRGWRPGHGPIKSHDWDETYRCQACGADKMALDDEHDTKRVICPAKLCCKHRTCFDVFWERRGKDGRSYAG